MKIELKIQTLRPFIADMSVEDRTPEKIRTVVREKSDALNFDLDDVSIEDIAKKFELQFSVTQDFGFVVRKENSDPWWQSAVKGGMETHYSDRFTEYLLNDPDAQLPLAVVTQTDEITDQIIDLAGNPDLEGHWKRRGMVIGHVQSGKTLNYSSVINKAADAGYRIIILLAGLTNSLRRQTQDRIDHAFIGVRSSDANVVSNLIGAATYASPPQIKRPNYFTSLDNDFLRSSALATKGMQIGSSSEPSIFVCKKNVSTLKNVYEFLKDKEEVLDQPFLMIDDEADNASINTLIHKDKVTAINQALRNILSLFNRSSYMGYTATPFANIFIDPETEDEMGNDDLFPSDFIKTLEAPSNYVGPDDVFGEHGRLRETMVLTPDDYKKTLDPKHKSDHRLEILPKSLEEAVLVFVLAKALRLWRGHDKKHCTMMVNVSRFNRVQQDAHTLIQAFLKTVQNDIYENAKLKKYPKNSVLHELRRLYQEEFLAKAIPEQKPNYPDWYDLDFFKSVRFMKVATVNMSSEPLNYDSEPDGLTVIAIGGLALSRGLTLEGLTVSYILRNASAYDTLMQMGRWFGYRRDYEDLCRLYIPKKSKDHYKDTAEAIAELREELKHMQDLNKTPADFGLKVRRHPSSFAITAANKMKTAKTVTHFHNLSGMNIEGHSLYKDDSKNSHNRKLVSNFIQTLGPAIEGENGIKRTDLFWENVPARLILEFISEFELPHTCTQFEYIKEINSSVFGAFVKSNEKELSEWQVGIQNPSIMEPGFYQGLVPDFKLGDRKRESGVIKSFAYGEVYSFTNNRKLGAGTDKLLGLVHTDIEELKERYKKTDLSAVDCKSIRTKPLLLIYEVNATLEGKSVFEEKPVSFGVFLPEVGTADAQPVTYSVNKIAQQLDLLSPEDDGDEAFELNALQER